MEGPLVLLNQSKQLARALGFRRKTARLKELFQTCLLLKI